MSQPDGKLTRQDRYARKLQAQCDAFNAENPVGTEVLVKMDTGNRNVITTTSSEARVLSGHTAVVWLDGFAGCYLLDRVSPVIAAFERQDGKLVQRRVAGGAS
jgi:hypothetical protein